MQILKVQLPSDPIIPYLTFCRLIADAVHPIDKESKGINCVIFKIYPAESKTLEFGIGVPYVLDSKDIKEFAKLLPKLPPLRYGMPEAEIDLFMKDYAGLPKRPIWTPVIASEKTAFEQKYKHSKIMDCHLQAIRAERAAGRLVPVDGTHVVMDTVQIGAHLSRQAAIAYLDRHGLAYESNEIQRERVPEPSLSSTDRKKRITQRDREIIFQRHTKNIAQGMDDPTQQIAEQYGVTVRWISAIVKTEREKAEKVPAYNNPFGVNKKK